MEVDADCDVFQGEEGIGSGGLELQLAAGDAIAAYLAVLELGGQTAVGVLAAAAIAAVENEFDPVGGQYTDRYVSLRLIHSCWLQSLR